MCIVFSTALLLTNRFLITRFNFPWGFIKKLFFCFSCRRTSRRVSRRDADASVKAKEVSLLQKLAAIMETKG